MARTRVIYTDDQDNQYALSVQSDLWSKVDGSSNHIIGGAVYTGSPALPSMPKGLKPRGVTVKGSTSGQHRRVICLTRTAPLYQGDVSTVDIYHQRSATAETANVISPEGEHRRALP